MSDSPEDRNGHDGGWTLPPAAPSLLPGDLRTWDGGEVIDLRADLGDPPVPEATSWDLAWPELDVALPVDAQDGEPNGRSYAETLADFDRHAREMRAAESSGQNGSAGSSATQNGAAEAGTVEGRTVEHRFDPLTDPLPEVTGGSGYDPDRGFGASAYSSPAPAADTKDAATSGSPPTPGDPTDASADTLRALPKPTPAARPTPRPVRELRSIGETDPVEFLSRPLPPRGKRRLTADDLVPHRRERVAPERRRRRRIFGGDSSESGSPPAPVRTPLDAHQRELVEQIRAPLPDGHRLAVVSLKGGVGKTTATAMLGSTLATHRIDRIVAIDANPDRGTLAEKIDRTTQMTVRDLITAAPTITRFSALQRYVHQTSSRLDIVASESDPAASHAFDEDDYAVTIDILERYYNLILTDCGTGLLHAATRAALASADSLLVVSSSSIDGARSAAATLDWLEAHGRGDLAVNAVAIINESRADSDPDDLERIEEHFANRCRAVERIPYDPHLAMGTVVDLDEVHPQTLAAFRSVAAAVVVGAVAAAESKN